MTAATSKTESAPLLKGQIMTRAPVSQSTLDDPMYVAVSPTSTHDLAWAALGREWELMNQMYVVVRPEEVEVLPGGSYVPQQKHFGVRFLLDKKAPDVRMGQHVLMKVPKVLRNERLAKDAQRGQTFKPKRTDKGEQAKLIEEGISTVGDELNV